MYTPLWTVVASLAVQRLWDRLRLRRNPPREAVVYRVNGRFVTGATVEARSGFGLDVDPVSLGPEPDAPCIAAAIARALAQSGRVVPDPERDQRPDPFAPFLKAAGVRSHKAFMATAELVQVEEGTDSFIVMPFRNLGPRQGFEGNAAEAVTLPDLDSAAQAVLDLLRRSST